MPEKIEKTWPRFVRTPEAARLLDLSPRTLEKHRCDGTGPVYHKLGGRVVYAVSDLAAWVERAPVSPRRDPLRAMQPTQRADRRHVRAPNIRQPATANSSGPLPATSPRATRRT